MKKGLKKFLLVLALFLPLFAQADEPSGADAARLVQGQADLILGKLSSDKAMYESDPQAFSRLISKEVLPHFDMDLMTRFVLGRHARDVSEAQSRAFREAFVDLLIRVYSNGWSKYADSTVKVTNAPKADQRGRTHVRITISTPDGRSIPGVFSMRIKDGAWKVYDVSFENVSILTSYRNSFDSEIRSKGIDQVTQDMRTMNVEQFEGAGQ